MICSGSENPHVLEDLVINWSSTNHLENLERQSHSFPGGQYGSFKISVKDEGYPESQVSLSSKRNMGLSSPMWDYSYCQEPSQQTECDSRLGIKKQFGLLGMEASSPVISENLSIKRNPRNRSICFQAITSDQDLLFVEGGSIEPKSRCLPTKLVPQKSLSFSPILHDLKKCPHDDPCNSSLAITTVVPRSNENVHTTTNFTDLEERSLKNSKERNSSPCPKQNLKISGMDGPELDYKRKNFKGGFQPYY